MRLFAAVLFSDAMREALLSTIEQMRFQGARGNFTRADTLHLTLAFLGETDAAGCAAARRALKSCGAMNAFEIVLNGAGRFGDLWWAGLQNSAPLAALAQTVQNALNAEGFSLESRPFRPHITLARQVCAPQPLRLSVPAATSTVERASLMRSDRLAGRLVYTEIFSVPLRKNS